jgi:L-threonylcarbamoyladenylate synthase
MRLSPTRAEHVDPDLAEIVLDGGPCQVGLESTVVDCTGPQVRVLRPGAIRRADLAACLGQPLARPIEGPRRSPGLYRRHYAPQTPVRIVGSGDECEIGFRDAKIVLPRNAAVYGSQLYAALHALDAQGLREIRIEAPPETPEWEAVWDRLRRATGTP